MMASGTTGTNMTRRGFLGAAGACAALGGLHVASAAEVVAEPTSVEGVEWAGTYDVIVVGAGLAGLTAAATVAAEGNGATCLLLEKGEGLNGNSPYSAGFQMTADDLEGVTTYVKALVGDATPADVLETFVEGMAESLDWTLSLGANEGDIAVVQGFASPGKDGEYPELPGSDTLTCFRFTGEAGGPKHVVDFMRGYVEQHSDVVDFRTSCAMEALVQDAQGVVVGVRANGEYYAATRGVVVCTGGFERDAKMLYDFTGVCEVNAKAGVGNTGDGIRACMRAGAGLWHMNIGAMYWMEVRDLDNTQFLSPKWNFTNKRWGITVGMNGRRFFMDFDGAAVREDKDSDGNAVSLADPEGDLTRSVGYRHAATQFGGEWRTLPMPPTAWFVFDADNVANAIDPEVSADPAADGWALCADTLEELASLMGVPSDELAHTVEVWNGFCDEGEDKAFYRPATSLTKVVNPPFYAMLCKPTILNTDGGPVRDARARVLDPESNPIAHLYSAGEMGSVWGRLYNGMGNLAECSVFGRIAAREALANA